MDRVRVLIVDSADDARLVLGELERAGLGPIHRRVETAQELEAALDEGEWDLLLSDCHMPRLSSSAAFELVRQRGLDLPLIVVSSTTSDEVAGLAMQAGAHDYVGKNSLRRLGPAVRRELQEANTRRDRDRMQSALLQADRMASMGTLAAGVAHEINNPLTYILFSLQSLLEDLPRVVEALERPEVQALVGQDAVCQPEALLDLVQQVREALAGAHRVRDIVGDIRTFARVDEERRFPVELGPLITGAARLAHHEIKYRARLELDLECTPSVLAHDGLLSQVFLNLLINAAHAIEEGDLEHNTISVRTRAEPGQIVVEIQDTGRGIDADDMARVFDPFFSTKSRGQGTGLGLTICKNIIEAHGGTIALSSEVGAGTTVVVRLPASSARLPTVVPGPAVANRRGRVLVVDDDELLRRALVRVLAERHDVSTAGSGNEARRLLQHDARFDVVLSDLMMEDGSGMELYEWLEGELPDLARRTVFISGGGVTHRGRTFLDRLDRERVLTKPLDIPRLLARVATLVAP